MKMIDELKPLIIYPADKKVYIPIDEKDRRKNSAVLLLTPSIDDSINLMKTPYIYNPNSLYMSFFIDRNISAFIDYADKNDLDLLDEIEESTISESIKTMYFQKIKFNIDENNATMVDRSYMLDIFNIKNARQFIRDLQLINVPDKSIDIHVYTSISALKEYIPNIIKSTYSNKLYSYSDEKGIHVLASICYDANHMHGSYPMYLMIELYNYLIKMNNDKIPYEVSRGISMYMSGLLNEMLAKNSGQTIYVTNSEINIIESCMMMAKSGKFDNVIKYLRDANSIKFNKSILFQKIDEKKKKYTASKEVPNTKNKEETVKESFINTDYADIMKICNSLPSNELGRITFYDTYRDSEFVVKRIIHRDGLEPVGFLDAYWFPSKPDLLQIVIAVHADHRGEGISKEMVKELLNDKSLIEKYRFGKYYWTAHTYNTASQNLAKIFGFINTGEIDKYGRMVFVKNAINDPIHLEGAVISTNPSHANKFKQYLYKERLRNQREIIDLYTKVKASVPFIKKSYPKLSMYNKFNLFVDLSYYHGLFLKNNKYKLNQGIDIYGTFLSKLISENEIENEYKNKTVFIPIQPSVWGCNNVEDLIDFRSNLNPISLICRLARTNSGAIRTIFKNKRVLFLGTRGYITADLSNFDVRESEKFKIKLRKLLSGVGPVYDEEDMDSMKTTTRDVSNPYKYTNSKRFIVSDIIDNIEDKTSIRIDDISKVYSVLNKEIDTGEHLKITSSFSYTNINKNDNNNLAVVWINPDKEIKKKEFAKAPIIKDKNISVYCLPE